MVVEMVAEAWRKEPYAYDLDGAVKALEMSREKAVAMMGPPALKSCPYMSRLCRTRWTRQPGRSPGNQTSVEVARTQGARPTTSQRCCPKKRRKRYTECRFKARRKQEALMICGPVSGVRHRTKVRSRCLHLAYCRGRHEAPGPGPGRPANGKTCTAMAGAACMAACPQGRNRGRQAAVRCQRQTAQTEAQHRQRKADPMRGQEMLRYGNDVTSEDAGPLDSAMSESLGRQCNNILIYKNNINKFPQSWEAEPCHAPAGQTWDALPCQTGKTVYMESRHLSPGLSCCRSYWSGSPDMPLQAAIADRLMWVFFMQARRLQYR